MNPQIRSALRMATVYALFGVAWIFFSDRLLLDLAWDQESLSAMQTYKGWFFVLITSILVFLLLLRTEYRFRYIEDRFRSLVETSTDLIWEVDPRGNYTYVSPAAETLLGYQAEEIIGKSPFDFMPPEEALRIRELWTATIAQKQPITNLINTNLHRQGRPIIMETSGEPFFDQQGNWQGYRGIDRDITARLKSESQLERLAYYDPLTNLPNRLLLQIRLKDAMEQAARRQTLVGVHFIDLDQFKVINDSFSHQRGDELLVMVGERWGNSLHHHHTLARFGGDEFIVIQELQAGPEEAAETAEKLLATLAEPFALPGGHEIYLGASIGISIFPTDGETTADLLRKAEAAMYYGKEQGRSQYCLYSTTMSTNSRENLRLEAALRQAVERNELQLYYQPKFDLHSNTVIGVEALARWPQKNGESIPPARFVPLAEKTGLIGTIGTWVLNEACRQLRAWRDQGLPELHMAVNVSPRQFHAGNLAEVVAAALREHGIPPHLLELEITESILMDKPDEAAILLEKCTRLGVKVTLDDFGTGYSSFAYLSRFPISALKIDRSFVHNLDKRPNAAVIIDSIISLVRRMGLKAVAEGVETAKQLAYLRQRGCDQIQGYLVSHPRPAPEIVKTLEEFNLKT